MKRVYVLRNSRDEFLDKSGEWISGGDIKSLYRTEHKDEALNKKVDFAVKHPDVRIRIVDAEQGAPNELVLPDDALLPSKPLAREETPEQIDSLLPPEDQTESI